jgi:hypothetical protein
MTRRTHIRRHVFRAHAAITAIAGVVLAGWPSAIPAVVGIHITHDAYLLSYLLAAAEFSFAILSWFAAKLVDAAAIRAIILACVVLHAISGLLEAIIWRERPAPVLLGNIVARLLIVAAFAWLLPRSAESGRPTARAV